MGIRLGFTKSGAAPSTLAVGLDEGWVYWRLSAAGAERCKADELPVGPLFRTSRVDVCIDPGRTRGRQLQHRIVNELQAQSAYCRQGGLVFATPLESIFQDSHRVVPMGIVLAAICAREKLTGPRPIGLLLGSGKDALTLVWIIQPSGALSYPTVAPGDDDDAKASTVRYAGDDAGISEVMPDCHWVTPSEFYAVARTLRCPTYPLQSEWHGVPKIRLAQGAVAAAAAYAVLGSGYWAVNWNTGRDLRAEQHAISQKPKLAPVLRRLAATHAEAIAKLQSLDPRPAFAAARALWRPSTHVDLNLKTVGVNARHMKARVRGQIVVTVDHVNGQPANHAGATKQLGASRLGAQSALNTVAPPGWRYAGVEIDGAGRLMQVKYVAD